MRVSITEKAVRDIDDCFKEKINKIIEKIIFKIDETKDILDQLTNEIEGIKLIWEDLRYE